MEKDISFLFIDLNLTQLNEKSIKVEHHFFFSFIKVKWILKLFDSFNQPRSASLGYSE